MIETFDITEYNQKECEKEIRKSLENYNDLEDNAKENLVLFCLIGIAQVHKDNAVKDKQGVIK